MAYDHGTVTESQEGLCGDYINFEGTWEFTNNETEITLIATRAAGATEEMAEPITIGSGVVTTLTTDRLVISVNGDSEIVEFKKK